MHLKRELQLPRNGMVLEIGGGGTPHPCSDVLVDRFVDDQEGFDQRGRVPLVVGDRVLIQADGSLLPFLDRRFDYVMVSHVIEHIPVEDVRRFVSEVQRVAPVGYVEAPSILYEAIRDIPEHVWYVACRAGAIHLAKKTSASRWGPFISPLFDDGDFCSVIEKYADLFFTGLEWTGSLQLEIHGDVQELVDLYPRDWAREVAAHELSIMRQGRRSVKSYAKQAIPPLLPMVVRKLARNVKALVPKQSSRRPKMDWRDLVVCPHCHSELRIDLDATTCAGCHRRYEIRRGGIPSFVDAGMGT